MTARKKAAAKPAAENVVAQAGNARLVMQTGEEETGDVQEAGERGPKSALEGGAGSLGASSDNSVGETDEIEYSVQVHTDEDGVEVFYETGKTGDEAAQKALKRKNYRGASIRGVTPASDPDANSLGGERDAAIMFADAENEGAIINTLGTEANAEATRELRKKDVKELGE